MLEKQHVEEANAQRDGTTSGAHQPSSHHIQIFGRVYSHFSFRVDTKHKFRSFSRCCRSRLTNKRLVLIS